MEKEEVKQSLDNEKRVKTIAERKKELRTLNTLKVLYMIVVILTIAYSAWMFIQVYVVKKSNYFFEHFGLGLTLVLIGVCGFLLPIINEFNPNSSDNKGDGLMMLIGIIMMIFGLGTILFTFL